MIKKVIQINIIITAALYCGMAGAHEKVSMEKETCTRRLDDGTMVHMSASQQQHEPSDQYCTEIPREGNTLLVIDLVDQALRNIPVGMRVVRGTSEVDDETVTYLCPNSHPDRVMRGETSLGKGLYTVFITGDAVPPVHYEYPLRVQMINYANIFRAAIEPMIALLLLTLLGYKLMKSRQV
ncbi:hypothetical protein [Nitrosomonas sp. Nm34]|uniref:hypothetical protein n=1 Tax=Nitrosomonas sp. Nm34 TaxID=1881055 RepID=UPI0008E7580E|nr:hypothetical protein [Nitrosomonas sp. Nm34]SFI73370.1 hypothetical protein SAMN05428978_10314 [Nitrosomonas sp. Nm34]